MSFGRHCRHPICTFDLAIEGTRTSFSTKDVIPLIKEVCQPVELGLQLDVEYTFLQKFEKDFRDDIGRQMIAVIDFWLKNSDNCSWGVLAQAIKRLGGHDRLVSTLNQMESKSHQAEHIPEGLTVGKA